jgi:tetraacyldisaccharide 4'-kinase
MDAAGKLGFSQLRMTTVEAAQGTPDGLRRPFARRLVRRASGPGAAASAGGLYRRVVTRKRARFLSGESASYRAPVPVIVVGNITVGGTGKTPMILWLIEHCRQRAEGRRGQPWLWRQAAAVAVAGAGRSARRPGRRRAAADRAAHRRAADDRPRPPRAVQALLASEPLDLILCDDGMQHYRLARDLELVLIDAARGLGNGRCLPAGPLREPAERLQRRCGAVQRRRADRAEGFGFACSRPRWSTCAAASAVRSTISRRPALHAVAGIGNPQRFFNTLLGLNWQPVPHPSPTMRSSAPRAWLSARHCRW